MTSLKVSKGSQIGPTPSVVVCNDDANWPSISGRGNHGSADGVIMLTIMDGADGGAPDPRVATWPADFVGVLRAVAARDPEGEIFFGAVAPAGKIHFCYFAFAVLNNPVEWVATALRVAGFTVELGE